jgi:predicted ATPase/class 3 adenylate cyclase
MAELPSGVVTFLMTDIEGSTRLWAEAPDAMRAALARHDAITTFAVAEQGGFLLKPRGEGDSTFSVFGRPTDAVNAACALQTALTAESWPEGAALAVRIAVHTGEADLGVDDYYGMTVNRCARLRSIAHGGQVLVSEATAGLVRELLSEGIALRDLGFQRLRDLAEPERVSQLLHASLPSDFPALRTIDLVPNNLPYQVSTFVGREAEMTKIRELLRGTRLLTLTGAGGVGKTRLALQAAAEMLYEYPDGVWLVDFAALSDGGLVWQVLATALSVREEPGQALAETVLAHLSKRNALLLLDNCEHLVEACARLAEDLTKQCPATRILATSREALRAEGETVWRVPSLSVPHPEPGIRPQPEQLTQYEAVRLFVDRATKAKPGFAVTSENAPAVAEICSRLDGMPLAVELAAARTSSLTPRQIEQRLDERFRLLTGGRRTALPRQQTLEATVDWSYDLLPQTEQRLFARLSVFAGGFTLEAAETVCAGDGIDPTDIADILGELVAKSLAIADTERYWMLETLREYGRRRLKESREAEEAVQRHAAFYAALAEEAKARPKFPGVWGGW